MARKVLKRRYSIGINLLLMLVFMNFSWIISPLYYAGHEQNITQWIFVGIVVVSSLFGYCLRTKKIIPAVLVFVSYITTLIFVEYNTELVLIYDYFAGFAGFLLLVLIDTYFLPGNSLASMLVLSERSVSGIEDGFADRPYPFGKMNFTDDEINSISKYLNSHFIAYPYSLDNRRFLIFSKGMFLYLPF